MEKYWRPALIAGIIGGFISAIPIINLANCCCLWIVATVVWAAYMYKSENGYVDIGPGAALGALTGGIAGFVSAFLGLTFTAVFGLGAFYQSLAMKMYSHMNMDIPYDEINSMSLLTPGMQVLNAIIGIITFVVIGTLVGIVMGAIWPKPKQPQQPQPQVIDAEIVEEDKDNNPE